MRVLHVGPLPPTPSGIADYAAELLPHLAEQIALDLAIADDAPAPPWPWQARRLASLTDEALAGYDVRVYQVGNHRVHAPALRTLAQWPGVVVLHDAWLHHPFADLYLARGQSGAYLRELAFAGGAAAVRRGAEAIAGIAPPAWDEIAMTRRVARQALGVVVHSRAARRNVLDADPTARVYVVPLGIAPAPSDGSVTAESRARTLGELGIPADAFVVGSFGGLTREKRVDSTVAAFARVRAVLPSAWLVIAGEAAPAIDLAGLLRAHGVSGCTRLTGRVETTADLERLIAAADVCVQLRWPTFGEASGVVVRAMRLGRPVVVSDTGWFAELPKDAVRRIAAEQTESVEVEALARTLVELASRPNEREALSMSARRYAVSCGIPVVARQYVGILSEVAARFGPKAARPIGVPGRAPSLPPIATG